MSDNKYIIDENSLVGIANAIRDKLGVGTGIDDDKAGYYSKQIKMLGFTQPDSSTTYQGSGSGYLGKTFVSCSASAIENIGGIRPSYVRVTLPSVNATSDRIKSYDSTTGTTTVANFTNGVAILSLPDNINNYSLEFEIYYSGSGWTQYLSYPSFDVVFLDEDQEVIDISNYSGESFRFYNTRNFLIGMKDFPIPYSIEDMQDKVTNYLGKISSEKVKVLKVFNDSSITPETGGSVIVSNYISIASYYQINFDSSSKYVTSVVPDLSPENILYMYYEGGDGRGSTTRFYFDSAIHQIEHYTSASIASGKRLSSATDYYFFKHNGTSNQGIMGMWDANNSILDLCFQQKQSSSGNTIISDYYSGFYPYPQKMLIIYKVQED